MEPIQTRRVATILAIGTANPINIFPQAEHPDFYFRATNSQHMTQLKHKFKRICEKSTIGKRHLHLTEEILKENPTMSTLYAPSLDARQAILINEVPKLGSEAALKAMEEWGQPASKITHLIFATSSGIGMPGADFKLAQLIGLDPCVQRIMIYQQGCLAGGAAIRIAKDVAENNAGSRVLIVCSEIMSVMCHHAPSDDYLDVLVGSALFSDGAAALVVGADPDATKLERPIFQIVSTFQRIIPDSDTTVVAHIREMGLQYYISKGVLEKIESIAVKFFSETFTDEYGVSDWNSLFHVVHPGGPSILTAMEEKLGLEKKKLRASRHVLSEHGNMWSPSVLFVLDEMRRNSIEEGKSTTGEGLDLGVLFSFGPGLTVEIAVLRSVPI